MAYLQEMIYFLSVTLVLGLLFRKVGVPMIAGFIIAGFILGPYVTGVIEHHHEVEVFAEIGVALLLFSIGVEISLDKLKNLWKYVFIGGGFQVVVTVALVALIAAFTGVATQQAIFFGFLFALSSTTIVLRGLQAKGDLHTPHGQFALGVLVFQDLCVIPMMLLVPVLVQDQGVTMSASIVEMLRSTFFCFLLFVGGRLVVPRILDMVASSRERELFVISVLLSCLLMAIICYQLGASFAMGAFLGGMIVAGSRFRDQALKDLIPFRELFVSIFFVSIGLLFDPKVIVNQPGLIVGIFLLVIFGKSIVIWISGLISKLSKQYSFLSALILCQVGEFSFILASSGLGAGLITEAQMKLFLAITVPTMIITPLLIQISSRLAFKHADKEEIREVFDVPGIHEIADDQKELHNHIVIVGYGKTGQDVCDVVKGKKNYLVIDRNPENVKLGREKNEPVYMGDIAHEEIFTYLNLKHADLVVLAINNIKATIKAIEGLRTIAPELKVVARGQYIADISALEEAGAKNLVIAEEEAAKEIVTRVEAITA